MTILVRYEPGVGPHVVLEIEEEKDAFRVLATIERLLDIAPSGTRPRPYSEAELNDAFAP